MKRRKFLYMLGLGGSGVLLGAPAASGGEPLAGPQQDCFGVLHDAALCIGCRKCEAGCARVNGLPVPEKPFDDLSVLEQKRDLDINAWTTVNRYSAAIDGGERNLFRKQQCNHCLEPACVSACFAGAMSKSPDGPVTYDPKLCVGCRYCMMACPYYVPAYAYNDAWNPLVYKCNLCAARIRQGQLPGCVEDCPNSSLIFGRRKDLLRLAWERVRANPGVYVEHVYGEHEMGGSSWLYLSPVPHDKLGLPKLGGRSAPDLTSPMTGLACMAAGLLPVLLGGLGALHRAGCENDKGGEQ